MWLNANITKLQAHINDFIISSLLAKLQLWGLTPTS